MAGVLHFICRCYAQRKSDTDNGINFLWFLKQRACWEIIKELNELALNIIHRLPTAIWLQIASLPVELKKARLCFLSLFDVIPYKLTFYLMSKMHKGLQHLFFHIWKNAEEQVCMDRHFFFFGGVAADWKEAGFYPQDNTLNHPKILCYNKDL